MKHRKVRPLKRPRHDPETINRFAGKMSERLFQAAHAGAVHVSAEHIGQMLQIPTGTAKSRLHRATSRIDELLAAEAASDCVFPRLHCDCARCVERRAAFVAEGPAHA